MPEITINDGIITGSLPRRALNLVLNGWTCTGMSCWRTGDVEKEKKVS